MKDFFRHNGILILIAAILLALVTAVVSMLFGGVADPLSNLVGILTTPVRNGITAVTNWAEEKYNDAFELEQMKEELAGLKQRNAELEAQAREAEAALQENERLRNLLELQPKEWSCDKAAAMVTARSTSNWATFILHIRHLQHFLIILYSYFHFFQYRKVKIHFIHLFCENYTLSFTSFFFSIEKND